MKDWDRGQVTLRLTKARKERLMLLAAREGVGGGPTDAVDRAIEVALAPSMRDELREELAALRELMELSGDARRRQDDRLERALADLSGGLAALSQALASLADES